MFLIKNKRLLSTEFKEGTICVTEDFIIKKSKSKNEKGLFVDNGETDIEKIPDLTNQINYLGRTLYTKWQIKNRI